MTDQPTLTVDQQVVKFLEQVQRNDGLLADRREMEFLESSLNLGGWGKKNIPASGLGRGRDRLGWL